MPQGSLGTAPANSGIAPSLPGTDLHLPHSSSSAAPTRSVFSAALSSASSVMAASRGSSSAANGYSATYTASGTSGGAGSSVTASSGGAATLSHQASLLPPVAGAPALAAAGSNVSSLLTLPFERDRSQQRLHHQLQQLQLQQPSRMRVSPATSDQMQANKRFNNY